MPWRKDEIEARGVLSRVMQASNAIPCAGIPCKTMELPQFMPPDLFEILVIHAFSARPNFYEYWVAVRRKSPVDPRPPFRSVRLEHVGVVQTILFKESGLMTSPCHWLAL